ncbi:Cysteine proteinase inhibitor [Glycine soja]
MGEDSWSLVRTHLLIELDKFSEDYIKLFGDTNKFEDLRMSLHVDRLTKVTMDKWMDITDMGYVIASRYNVILVSLFHQKSMTFFSLRSQPPRDSSVHRIICIGHVYGNHFVQIYLKDRCPLPPIALLWSSNCHPQAKQIHNILQLTDKQYLDEIYYWQSFTDIGNHLRFQCMQLKNDDDDVNTMLMCNHQFSSVGPIELLCIIGRIPNGILNILEATMTLTHDTLLYYNGRWNMPHQNEFEKNPKKFDIPSGCTMDELKDLIKQVAPHGIPPYGIHETQTYSDKIIKFEIIELKTNDNVLKVLVHSNYWKKFGPIEILTVFSKHEKRTIIASVASKRERERERERVAALGGNRDVAGSQNSLEIDGLARFAVEEHNKKQNALLEFEKVVSAKQQVVSGTLYTITLEAKDGGQKKVYEAKVWEKAWLNFKEVQEFKLVGDAPA